MKHIDLRSVLPQFQPGNININLSFVNEIQKLATKKNCTAAQLARENISWRILPQQR